MCTTINPPERGVYTCNWYDASGDFVAFALSSKGCCVAWLPYKPSTRDEVMRTLTHLLDLADPVPYLRAV